MHDWNRRERNTLVNIFHTSRALTVVCCINKCLVAVARLIHDLPVPQKLSFESPFKGTVGALLTYIPPCCVHLQTYIQGETFTSRSITNAVLVNSYSALTLCGPDSSDGIATGYGLDGPGIESRRGGEIFRTCPDRPWDPPNPLYNGYRVFPGDKEGSGRDVDPSPPSSAVVMKE
jgi:hypothetical protein